MAASVNLTVRNVMEVNPVSVDPDCSVDAVLRLMNEKRIGSVLVVVPEKRLVGIFTERDLLRRLASRTPGWESLPIREWMTPDPFVISPEVGWDEAVTLMHQLRVRHLPVVEADQVVGLISTRMLMGRRTEYLNRQIEERTAELRQANELLLARDAEMLHNLRAAGRLQTRLLLPHSPPDWPEFAWAIHFVPYDHLGGDYYDFATPSPNQLGFLIADASGHSLPAAMVAIMTRFAFTEAAQLLAWPGEVLSAINRRLITLSDERFVSGIYAIFDRDTQSVRYASAGHPPPFFYEAASGIVRPLTGSGFLLGIIADEVYTEREVILREGDRLLFYTDGLIDTRNAIGELFGSERVIECLRTAGRGSAASIMKVLLDALNQFRGGVPYPDDLTIVILEVRGRSAPEPAETALPSAGESW
jgi:sigma-B regulation protein RsbU (phosphoserine phosphatase)